MVQLDYNREKSESAENNQNKKVRAMQETRRAVPIRRQERQRRKKVLIVNCYFPEIREPIKRSNEVPNALAPVLLAGHFCPQTCDVRLYNEVNSGFIEVFEPELLEWPDMVVLTSLTAAFDRLLHVTAYVRSYNPNVIVAAGGHAVRALPRYSERFFDYTCLGDVEEITDVIRDSFGEQYVAREFMPRYDMLNVARLDDWITRE